MTIKILDFKQPINIPITEDKYKLMEDYYFKYNHQKYTYTIKVPKGFIYDGASVPKFFWSRVGIRPDGLIRGAATIHDWIYVCNGEIDHTPASYIRKSLADLIFYEAMIAAGMSKVKAKLAYWAVYLFGRY